MTRSVIANVLVVDDRIENLIALDGMLEPLGERVVTAQSGREALRHLLEEEFAVILLDVQMPILDGIETASLIRRRARNVDTPIIFVTASDKDEARVREAYALGAVDYVYKPVASEILRAKVSVFVELFKARKSEERRSRELAELNGELEAFSHSVSHDLRAPIRRIQGFCSALRDELAEGGASERAEGYLARIERCSRDMDALIQDLLRLSRVTRADVRVGEVDLSALARMVVSELRRGDPAREVRVEIEDGLTCRGDEPLMCVAIENLLSNAWKYTSKSPDARIEVGEQRGPGERAFFVRDNGAGFDMEFANKLFAVFQRLHSAQEFEGTGVGLATVQRVIRKHEGRVWGEGVVGEGATFFFTVGALD